jgi:DNA-binding FadR family transcriptional regulator
VSSTDDPRGFRSRPRDNLLPALVNELVQRFLDPEVRPGSKLPPERELAASLGVGRSNLREALKVLDLLGLIEIRQGDGTYLRGEPTRLLPQVVEWGVLLGGEDADELVDARVQLEIGVARLAADRASGEDIEKLASLLEQMQNASDNAEFADADGCFHLALAGAARNSVLEGMLVNVRSLIHAWIMRAARLPGVREDAVHEHGAILDAVRGGDADEAARAMLAHMASARSSLDRSVEAGD